MLRETTEINMDNITLLVIVLNCLNVRIQELLLMMVMLLDLRRNKY